MGPRCCVPFTPKLEINLIFKPPQQRLYQRLGHIAAPETVTQSYFPSSLIFVEVYQQRHNKNHTVAVQRM